jgi:hypothetical protein
MTPKTIESTSEKGLARQQPLTVNGSIFHYLERLHDLFEADRSFTGENPLRFKKLSLIGPFPNFVGRPHQLFEDFRGPAGPRKN